MDQLVPSVETQSRKRNILSVRTHALIFIYLTYVVILIL